MNDVRPKTAHILIKIAAIIRLSITAVLILALLYSLSGKENDLYLMYYGVFRIIKRIVIPGFLFDTALTLLWLYRLDKQVFHLILYLVHAALNFCPLCFVYLSYALAFLHPYAGMGVIAAGYIAVFIWGIHLIPFIIGLIGVIKLWKSQEDSKNIKIYGGSK